VGVRALIGEVPIFVTHSFVHTVLLVEKENNKKSRDILTTRRIEEAGIPLRSRKFSDKERN